MICLFLNDQSSLRCLQNWQQHCIDIYCIYSFNQIQLGNAGHFRAQEFEVEDILRYRKNEDGSEHAWHVWVGGWVGVWCDQPSLEHELWHSRLFLVKWQGYPEDVPFSAANVESTRGFDIDAKKFFTFQCSFSN